MEAVRKTRTFFSRNKAPFSNHDTKFSEKIQTVGQIGDVKKNLLNVAEEHRRILLL